MDVSGQLHAPAALPPGKEPLVPIKLKLSLCLTKHHSMKIYWGSGGRAPRIFYLGTSEGEWSASSPGRFTLRERAPGIQWIGGWVGPRAGLILKCIFKKLGERRREDVDWIHPAHDSFQ
jgi:hypothetical protein